MSLPTIVTVSALSTPVDSGVGVVDTVANPVQVRALNPAIIILVRVTKMFLQTLMGLLSAAGIGAAIGSNPLPAADLFHLLLKCGSISMGPALFCLGNNLYELLNKIDQRYPTLTA